MEALTSHTPWDLAALLGTPQPIAVRAIVVSESWLRFRYVENKGVVFGMLSGQSWAVRVGFFTVLAILAVIVLRWLYRAGETSPALRWCVPVVVGGVVGNYLDRVRLGYVIDFIEWHYLDIAWFPVFNLADVAIECGAAWPAGVYLWRVVQAKRRMTVA